MTSARDRGQRIPDALREVRQSMLAERRGVDIMYPAGCVMKCHEGDHEIIMVRALAPSVSHNIHRISQYVFRRLAGGAL